MTTKATFVVYIDWDNDGSVESLVLEANEDVTGNVLGVRTPVGWRIGRDGSRSLSGFQSGDIELELDNRTKLYSPDYGAGALTGLLGPGKPVRIRATSGTTRDIFRGFIDGYTIDPSKSVKSVKLTCVDAFAHVSDAVINTAFFQGIRSGEAITAILDAVGWSATKRDIDPGQTVIRHFWVENQTAGEAIKDVMESEGPPGICFVDGSNNFVFRDRSHRLLDANATTVQATFRDTGAETSTDVNFSDPAEYDVGYRDIVNSVSFDVEERAAADVAIVWTSDVLTIGASATIVVSAQTEEPFSNAAAATYVTSGSVTSTTLSRTSGQSTDVSLTAGAGGAVVEKVDLYAVPYPVGNTYRVTVEDSASITKYGRTSWTEGVPKWVGRNDALAIANVILNFRKERLPTFSVTVINANSNRLGQILDRDISDRVTLVETNTDVNDPSYIEAIEYNIEDIGQKHTATFFTERVPTLAPSDADVFILDSAVLNHRIDSGKLAY